MKKQDLINLLGGTVDKTAKRLGYAHKNSIQRLSDPLTERQVKDMVMRMKAKRIKFPREWVA